MRLLCIVGVDMAKFRRGKSFFDSLGIDRPASAPDEPVRLQEFEEALSGLAGLGHRHDALEIDGLAQAIADEIGLSIGDSETVEWSTEDDKRVANVRLSPTGGLIADPDGLRLDFGPGETQAAPGNHSHAQLHDPLTLGPSNSVEASLDGQQLTLEVRLEPDGGLKASESGLAIDFDRVAAKDHAHAQLHPPLGAESSASLSLSVGTNQTLRATFG